MKQYQISFYYGGQRSKANPTVYYREFESIESLVEFGNTVLNDCPWFIRFTYSEITLSKYLENAFTPPVS